MVAIASVAAPETSRLAPRSRDDGTASTAMSKVPWSITSSSRGPGPAGPMSLLPLAAAAGSGVGEEVRPEGIPATGIWAVCVASLWLSGPAPAMTPRGSNPTRAAAETLGGPATTGLVASATIAQAQRSTPRRGAALALNCTTSKAKNASSHSRCDANSPHFGGNGGTHSYSASGASALAQRAEGKRQYNGYRKRCVKEKSRDPAERLTAFPQVALAARFHRGLEQPFRSFLSSARGQSEAHLVGALHHHRTILRVNVARLVVDLVLIHALETA